MGIQVELNPDLALRSHGTRNRFIDECLPEKIEKGETYHFLKSGQRNYWLKGEIPLLETKGNQQLSRPLASIRILEATHYIGNDGNIWTKGKYEVTDVFDIDDPAIHFEGLEKISSTVQGKRKNDFS